MAPSTPPGYSTVSPYLVVTDAAATIDFVVRVLGGTESRRMPDGSGGVAHAEVRIGECVVMLGDAAEGWPACPAHVHVYVADVDATHRAALAAGAVSVQAPERKGDEDRRGGVQDAGGTTWWIATRVG
jgi:PhnB protein